MISVKDQIEASYHSVDISTAVLGNIKFSLLLASAILLIAAAYFSPHIWRHGEAREAW